MTRRQLPLILLGWDRQVSEVSFQISSEGGVPVVRCDLPEGEILSCGERVNFCCGGESDPTPLCLMFGRRGRRVSLLSRPQAARTKINLKNLARCGRRTKIGGN